MKKLLSLKTVGLILAACIACGFFLVSCEDDGYNDGIFTDHKSSYSIKIRNNSAYNLVAYAEDVKKNNLIGGIYGPSGDHCIKQDSKFFGAEPKYFRMVFLTEADYKLFNKGSITEQEANNRIITSVFIFWNGTGGDNSKVYEISASMGGQNGFTVANPTNFNVELRTDGASGPTLGYAPNGMAFTKLYSIDPDLIVFPVFLMENTVKGYVETVFPLQDGPLGYKVPARKSLSLTSDGSGVPYFDLASFASQLSERKTGASFIEVTNSAGGDIGSIAFCMNNQIQYTVGDKGTYTKYFSGSREFRIDMLQLNEGYAETKPMGNLQIETGGFFYNVVTKESYDARQEDNTNQYVNAFTINSDYVYKIIFSGNSYANAYATIEIRNGEINGPEAFVSSIKNTK